MITILGYLVATWKNIVNVRLTRPTIVMMTTYFIQVSVVMMTTAMIEFLFDNRRIIRIFNAGMRACTA